MTVLFTGEEAVVFCKFLHDLNQIIKTVDKSEDVYFFNKGSFMVNGKKQLFPYINVLPKYTKKNEFIEERIADLVFPIDGQKFFNFQKDYKKDVTEVEIDHCSIIIRTSIPLAEYEEKLDIGDRKPFTMGSDTGIGSFSLSEEQIDQVIDAGNSPVNICMDFGTNEILINEKPENDDDGFLEIILNQKFLTGLKKKQRTKNKVKYFIFPEVSVYPHDFKSEQDVYAVNIVISTAEYEIDQWTVITDIL
jgi:hypothetical protein